MKNILKSIKIPALLCVLLISNIVWAQSSIGKVKLQPREELLFKRGVKTLISLDRSEAAVVKTALSLLQKDVQSVFNADLEVTTEVKHAIIVVGTLGRSQKLNQLIRSRKVEVSGIQGKWESFILQSVIEEGRKKLLVVGSDDRGTAYGLMELSRLLGVSPWEWWADATPEKREYLAFPKSLLGKSPSVQYRGIFLNDEDWGLMPWSSQTYEPGLPTVGKTKGAIGPKTYAKIFELLLRLRANTIWPAMHEVTVPFYFSKGNKEVADQYGIILGTSHCEPLMRNSATEWDIAGKGDYNYKTNKDAILSYWTDRLKELKGAQNIYTLGLRGKHDGMMQGVKGLKEHHEVLSQVLKDQRQLLATYVNEDLRKVPQVFIPYKEVLDVYNNGLQVPDDVTLIWCDDNYGYLTHFPTEAEQKRAGGNGVYYHLSYWGRPHDYLWLGTASPALLAQQMQLAYDKGARKQWIVNVGDIKPTEYQMELFLDMAWNMEEYQRKGLTAHLENWLEREFGKEKAAQLLPVMQEHYRLAFIRKPEFMGNTRGEESDPSYKVVKDLPWTESEIQDRLSSYAKLYAGVEDMASAIAPNKKAAFFELIQYPVQAAAMMNQKTLQAQLARHAKANWAQSDTAYARILTLTAKYNALNNGKWNRMMDAKPRKQPVFDKLTPNTAAQDLVQRPKPLYIFNGIDFIKKSRDLKRLEGLGYQGKAIAVGKGQRITIELGSVSADSVLVEVRLLPSHPVMAKQLRFGISLDDQPIRIIAYHTVGRSEEWKENVLRNQAIRRLSFPIVKGKSQQLTFSALDEGVVLDQIYVYAGVFQAKGRN